MLRFGKPQLQAAERVRATRIAVERHANKPETLQGLAVIGRQDLSHDPRSNNPCLTAAQSFGPESV